MFHGKKKEIIKKFCQEKPRHKSRQKSPSPPKRECVSVHSRLIFESTISSSKSHPHPPKKRNTLPTVKKHQSVTF